MPSAAIRSTRDPNCEESRAAARRATLARLRPTVRARAARDRHRPEGSFSLAGDCASAFHGRSSAPEPSAYPIQTTTTFADNAGNLVRMIRARPNLSTGKCFNQNVVIAGRSIASGPAKRRGAARAPPKNDRRSRRCLRDRRVVSRSAKRAPELAWLRRSCAGGRTRARRGRGRTARASPAPEPR